MPERLCDECPERKTCSFYEEGATECPYDALARAAETFKKREKKY